VACAAPVSAIAQERTSATAQWSTAVLPDKKSEARAPIKGEKKKRPAADVVPPPPAIPPVTASLPAAPPPAAEPSLPPAPVGQDNTRAPFAKSPDRLEHESTALEYCRNAVPAAGEARAAFLQQAIAALERDLVLKTQELEKRIAEHKDWMSRRQRLMDQAGTALVQMFARMRPDAAAQQVSLMDEPVAAALLMKLEPRASSALLSEMPPSRAARLAAIIAAAAELSPRQPAATSEPKR
jgi:flagellar motility protein MotE (MotC chaperone)